MLATSPQQSNDPACRPLLSLVQCVSKCDPKVTGCKGGCLVDNSTCVDSVVVPPPIVGGGGELASSAAGS